MEEISELELITMDHCARGTNMVHEYEKGSPLFGMLRRVNDFDSEVMVKTETGYIGLGLTWIEI